MSADSQIEKPAFPWARVYAALLIAAILAAILIANTGYSTAPRTATRSDACAMSQTFVKRQLKAPSTAKFPLWTEENCKVTQRGRIWIVRSYVDSQNSFGAMLRSDYSVEMIYYPSTDSWTLVNASVVEP